MATKYVSPTGSDSNNGDTSGTPYLTIDKAFDNLTGTGADIVILANGDYNQTTSLVTGGGTKTGGSITLQSASSDATLCSISGHTSTSTYLIRNNETGVNLAIENITLKDHTATNASYPPIFWADQDLTLTNCVIDNININMSGAVSPSGIIRNYHATLPANLTINGLTVRNCSVSFAGGSGYEGALFSTNYFGGTANISGLNIESFTITSDANYQFNGMCFHRGTNIWSGTNTFNNVIINGAHASFGLIKMESNSGAYQHKISGTMNITNVTSTLTTANGSQNGFINVAGTDDLTITAALNVSNCISTVPANEYDYGIAASISAGSSIHMFSPSAGVYSTIHDNSFPAAVGLVSHKGGVASIISAIHAYNNTVNSGVVAVVSLAGNTTLSGLLLHDNTATGRGGGIYCSPSASGTVTINNSTLVDNIATTSGDGMSLAEVSGTTAIYNVSNVICRNGGTDEISSAGSTGTPEINITNSNIQGGAGAVTGETTYTNNVDVDPLFIDSANNNYGLQSATTMRGAGKFLGAVKDYKGKAFPKSAIPIGGVFIEGADTRSTAAARSSASTRSAASARTARV